MNFFLTCPNPNCGNMVAKNLVWRGNVGDKVMEVKCQKCQQIIDVYLGLIGEIRKKTDLTTPYSAVQLNQTK